MVEKAIRMVREIGREPTTVDESKKIMGITR